MAAERVAVGGLGERRGVADLVKAGAARQALTVTAAGNQAIGAGSQAAQASAAVEGSLGTAENNLGTVVGNLAAGDSRDAEGSRATEDSLVACRQRVGRTVPAWAGCRP